MFGRLLHQENSHSHIPYAPAEELTDEQLSGEIAAMENSRLAPRKDYLRQERIQRRVSELGLAQTEVMLGITEDKDG